MILLDTNVLVALIDPRDQHASAARRDLKRFATKELVTIPSVLCEAVFLLPAPALCQGLRTWIQHADIQILPTIEEQGLYAEVFDWLQKYSDHLPDWTDANICVLSGLLRKIKIWTYDKEFRTTWCRPDGSGVPLALR